MTGNANDRPERDANAEHRNEGTDMTADHLARNPDALPEARSADERRGRIAFIAPDSPLEAKLARRERRGLTPPDPALTDAERRDLATAALGAKKYFRAASRGKPPFLSAAEKGALIKCGHDPEQTPLPILKEFASNAAERAHGQVLQPKESNRDAATLIAALSAIGVPAGLAVGADATLVALLGISLVVSLVVAMVPLLLSLGPRSVNFRRGEDVPFRHIELDTPAGDVAERLCALEDAVSPRPDAEHIRAEIGTTPRERRAVLAELADAQRDLDDLHRIDTAADPETLAVAAGLEREARDTIAGHAKHVQEQEARFDAYVADLNALTEPVDRAVARGNATTEGEAIINTVRARRGSRQWRER